MTTSGAEELQAALDDAELHRTCAAAADARARKAETAVARVRAFHAPEDPDEVAAGKATRCKGCMTGDPYLDQMWPCDTIKTLDGDQERQGTYLTRFMDFAEGAMRRAGMGGDG